MPHEGQTGFTFESGGHQLLGRLFMARGDNPKPTAVILHGLPGIEQNYDIAFALRDSGWNAAIFHYRGCWGSGGSYAFKTIPDDVRACLDTISGGAHLTVDPARLVLIGHSMGGWAAVLTAADDSRVRAVAVYGAVTDPRRVSLDDDAPEFTEYLTGLTPHAFIEQWHALDATYAPVERVSEIAPRPLLVIHAEPDEAIPVAQAEALAARASSPTELLIHPDANHAFTWHRAWLREQIMTWLGRITL